MTRPTDPELLNTILQLLTDPAIRIMQDWVGQRWVGVG